jgi:predicted  nucleic acid-binding Zn-ribbon protein
MLTSFTTPASPDDKEDRMFKCTVCGFIYDGDEAPVACPKCGAPREKISALTDGDAEKVERSRLTNSLHMQLLTILEEVENIAEQGIQDDLDPNCVKLFERAQQDSYELVQSIKAELAGHMTRGKWG